MISDRIGRRSTLVLLAFVFAALPGGIPRTQVAKVEAGATRDDPSPPTDTTPRGIDAIRARTVRIQITRWQKDSETGEKSKEALREPIAGFLMDDGERVLTSGDSLDGVEAIVVEASNGELRRGRGAHRDPQSGLGVVFVDALPVVPLSPGGEARPLSLGDRVLVCGDPANLGLAFTPATVAAFDRAIEVQMLGRRSRRAGLIQLAADCDDGDRGGPLASQDGHVVGICLGPYRAPDMPNQAAIAFAIPFEEARTLGDTLTEMAKESEAASKSKTPRPWLGVWAADIEDPALEAQLDLEDGEGILIENVFPDSPVERAGVRRFDVVSKIDGKTLRGTLGLRALLKDAKIGQTIELEVITKGQRRTVKVTLGTGN